jgi:hypothetical protein
MTETRYSREQFRLEIAYARGNGIDPIDHLAQLNRAAGWIGGRNE